jgi:hypothetical protein
LPGMRAQRTARDPDRTALCEYLGRVAARPLDQRAQRECAAHAVVDERQPPRRLLMLFAVDVTDGETGQGRNEELSHEPAVDDLALRLAPSVNFDPVVNARYPDRRGYPAAAWR